MSIYYLTLEDIQTICFQAVKQLYKFNEPLPEFHTRYAQKLEAILSIPETEVFGRQLYTTIHEKAACYFYNVIKNHPFLNGNKRVAVIATYVFLRLNDHELTASWEAIYDFAIEISSPTKSHEREFRAVVDFLEENTKPRPRPLL
ncbi:hypothetical protein A2690_01015 [Candidatus Roizmanbacteria bacterium RIFCSPHIGHO2_01_FULL_39_12b]|uniref:Fido domain-containing protein n=1 Tax=Candidatus Roizmanbacteria bacterium RIFCSPHIGHO2_01_FULL_39_12b TaxID=1802030 RepID=A0A1F7GA77_9BACT|nr:MAG: hypothetical protein A2690_01015 [Candidatus Roizmanbacteria bacterium RIFCSPHIGHO2_01_FULL_39_12b]